MSKPLVTDETTVGELEALMAKREVGRVAFGALGRIKSPDSSDAISRRIINDEVANATPRANPVTSPTTHPLVRDARWDWRMWPGVVSFLVAIVVGGLFAAVIVLVNGGVP